MLYKVGVDVLGIPQRFRGQGAFRGPSDERVPLWPSQSTVCRYLLLEGDELPVRFHSSQDDQITGVGEMDHAVELSDGVVYIAERRHRMASLYNSAWASNERSAALLSQYERPISRSTDHSPYFGNREQTIQKVRVQ